MAQDFYAAFGLGDSDKKSYMVDIGGVAFVAIQALQRKVAVLEAKLVELEELQIMDQSQWS